MEHQRLTSAIIAAAIAVHRELGPGFVESVYENALVIELQRRKISVERQTCVSVLYRGEQVGVHRLDLVIERQVLVELKAVREIAAAHFVTVRSYLRAMAYEHALLLNFAKPTLEVRRVRARFHASAPSWVPA